MRMASSVGLGPAHNGVLNDVRLSVHSQRSQNRRKIPGKTVPFTRAGKQGIIIPTMAKQ
jgi:hypothetical protein